MSDVKIKKLNDAEIEIEGEIPAEDFEKYFEVSTKDLGKDVEIKGFRKGHVPEKILLEKLGEPRVLDEMARRALTDWYAKVIEEEKLEVIGRPEINITKLARKNPLGFKVKQAVVPEIKLPDYKKIATKFFAEKMEVPETTEEELETVIKNIRQAHAHQKFHQENPDHKGHDHKIEEKDWPELTDDFVKTLGAFENVVQFREKIRENMKMEKEWKERDKRRVAAVEKIMEDIKVDLPAILIDREIEAMVADLKNTGASMGLEFKDYLEKMKKTEEDLRKEARGNAERRTKFGLTLNAIAKAEKIEVSDDEIQTEVIKVMQHHPNSDPQSARHYVEGVLKNEKVFQLLEKVA